MTAIKSITLCIHNLTVTDNRGALCVYESRIICTSLQGLKTKQTENALILRYNLSLSDCHFSLILLEGEVTSPYCQGTA